MSLIRQIWLLLLGTLAIALLASVSINVLSARETLQTQLRLKNADNATSLALVLSQLKGQHDLMEMTAAAQFDTGFYRRIRFIGADGKVVFEREARPQPMQAPAWFASWVAIDSEPGVAQVSDGWRALGSVEVISQSTYALDTLALAAVGACAALLALVGVARIRRPLEATVEQADSLREGEYRIVPEPKVPELRRLARAMNAMVERLRVVFESQAAHVESLRRAASCDALTGVSNRVHFLAQLRAAVQREDGHSAGGLVLLRILKLTELNQSLGRESTDRLIVSVADTLAAYAGRSDGVFVGRLNGSDFAVVLPFGSVANETALAMVALLRAAFAGMPGMVAVAAGVVETRHGIALAELMAAADLALAQAECAGPFSVESASVSGATWAGAGEHRWREQLHAALQEGRARLAEYPVVDAQRRVIHLECPLRLQLDENGPFEVAAHWLPLAVRSHLSPRADERALALALAAIAQDGRQRSVNLSPASLQDSGFAARVRQLLVASPQAAPLIWLEINETAAADQFQLMCELSRQVRACGAKFGLEHAGERLSRIEQLFDAGLDYVKLDAAVTLGVANAVGRAAFVKGLVMMLHGLSLQVIAEGVVDAQDARTLWDAGVDGITGPWVGTTGAAVQT